MKRRRSYNAFSLKLQPQRDFLYVHDYRYRSSYSGKWDPATIFLYDY